MQYSQENHARMDKYKFEHPCWGTMQRHDGADNVAEKRNHVLLGSSIFLKRSPFVFVIIHKADAEF
ncbi:hypothetical protein DTL21_05290 [Bremerella cremea]|uniref:Uncharacterized protein n=1 Tax=Blastopirellula marina TaxID=124 RepID=A0A2S8FZ60_9BACT|nr:hypothetical protein C5Y83_05290 [Blastopirellula marina]RCS49747.1 hypothetical protein DTL21_05290 [Bremerella cremea]